MMERIDVQQEFIPVEASRLITEVRDLKADGYRFGQACATAIDDHFEIIYSFDKDYRLKNLRLVVEQDQEVESITGDYWPAFIYENEMHDLFGIKFKHMALDYEGKFFKIAESTPWNPNK